MYSSSTISAQLCVSRKDLVKIAVVFLVHGHRSDQTMLLANNTWVICMECVRHLTISMLLPVPFCYALLCKYVGSESSMLHTNNSAVPLWSIPSLRTQRLWYSKYRRPLLYDPDVSVSCIDARPRPASQHLQCHTASDR